MLLVPGFNNRSLSICHICHCIDIIEIRRSLRVDGRGGAQARHRCCGMGGLLALARCYGTSALGSAQKKTCEAGKRVGEGYLNE